MVRMRSFQESVVDTVNARVLLCQRLFEPFQISRAAQNAVLTLLPNFELTILHVARQLRTHTPHQDTCPLHMIYETTAFCRLHYRPIIPTEHALQKSGIHQVPYWLFYINVCARDASKKDGRPSIVDLLIVCVIK